MGSMSVMGGCAVYQSRDKQAVSIKPLMDVKHAGGPEAMYWLGRYHQGKADHRQAIEAYEKALTENPGHVETHNGLGVCYFLEGRHELALQHLRKAIELSPVEAHLHNNLGYAHLLRGRDNEAATAFEQALRIDPENRQARRNLATVYEQTGLLDKAVILSQTGFDVSASPVAADGMPAPRPPIALRQAQGEREQGTPSISIPINLTTTSTDEQPVGQGRDAHLVQITPDVFELRMNEGVMMTNRTGENPNGDGASYLSASAGSKDGRLVVSIEVSNGNGVTGMARKVSEFLQQNGFARARLTDRRPFQQAQTEIQYRPGSYILADQIRRMMPNEVPMVESYALRRDIEVRVVLGKDVARQIAYF